MFMTNVKVFQMKALISNVIKQFEETKLKHKYSSMRMCYLSTQFQQWFVIFLTENQINVLVLHNSQQMYEEY